MGGKYVDIDGDQFYRIENFDQMDPFFMSIVSHLDSWMFISSSGGLSAGQKNEDNALFPYYTDDKITQSFETTGSKTLIIVNREGKKLLWEPFSEIQKGAYSIGRNLFKNVTGNTILFEEVNHDLELVFKYSWSYSEKYGFVKKSWVQSFSEKDIELKILDGIQNILPFGVTSALQRERGNLVNAYKRNELHPESNIGLFTLSSIIIDRAVPSEALKATVVYSVGLEIEKFLLSSKQLSQFRKGKSLLNESDIKAESGAFFIESTFSLPTKGSKSWLTVAELSKDHSSIIELKENLKANGNEAFMLIEDDLTQSTQKLKKLVGLSDGLQLTGDEMSVGRHFSNVMFNVMRGGLFVDQYNINIPDLKDFIESMNKIVSQSERDFFAQFERSAVYGEIIQKAVENGNADLLRLCYEYLPLSFSRRHGDPSRPWNKFSIETNKPDGSPNYAYQGNWRDIFQNWETLTISYPEFIESVIVKFLNASTADGYNPYRISQNGIDWEVIEPDDPWTFIGYWGDHQIIYLLKLLELSYKHDPDKLLGLLDKEIFVSANVPYRIKKYEDIYENPDDTIDFDEQLHDDINKHVDFVGADGKLVHTSEHVLLKSTFVEKLMVTFLTKMYNFIPDAGIWLNTQRPEWNDANNALVGNGVSMVTLFYLRRFVSFFQDVFDQSDLEKYKLNRPLITLFNGVLNVLRDSENELEGRIEDKKRKVFVDQLGKLGESYRESVYNLNFDGIGEISKKEVQELLGLSKKYFDASIRKNKREDRLYHSYNIVDLQEEEIKVSHLYEMLEGQVAVLTSGLLDLEEVIELLEGLKSSAIYRDEQYSYMLYPNRELPRFLEKNNLTKSQVERSELLKKLIENSNHSIVVPNKIGGFHFNGDYNNAENLKSALANLESKESYSELASKDADYLLELFEETFDHKSFTGRSGTFFGYEGLGSIYWHMVSKLLLAIQENIEKFKNTDANNQLMGVLIDHYYEIRAGIGINKTPDLYGGFPTDPYSHTPYGKGAQQPGMTGQVKEDIINRWAELGVHVRDSIIEFSPFFLSDIEFLNSDKNFEYYDVFGDSQSILLNKGSLGFTYCQVPIIYEKGDKKKLMVQLYDDSSLSFDTAQLTKSLSKELFERTGKVKKIILTIK
ncbi:MAG: hypothetical protein JXR07_01025 [Reichenbachiella sp.]